MRLELNHLISGQTVTDERDIFLRGFYSNFDYRTPGANRHIANVEPLFFQGLIAGSEFLTYAATKLYICLDAIFGGLMTGAATAPYVALYSEADAAQIYLNNGSGYWDAGAAAARYTTATVKIQNVYFSRLVVNTYAGMNFKGYRVTLD